MLGRQTTGDSAAWFKPQRFVEGELKRARL
jgi:hypothetical protein